MEKFLLRGVLAGDELDIVHEKEVGAAVFAAELDVLALLDGGNQLVGKLVALDIDDVVVGVPVVDHVGDGVQQVRFSEARRAVDEQRVIRLRRIVCHGEGRRVREAVGRADDKAVEGKLRVKLDEFRLFADRLAVGRHLILAQNDQLDVHFEKLAHGVLDIICAPAQDDLLPVVGGRIQNEACIRQLNDLHVVEPGGYDGGGQTVFHMAKHLGPNIGGGVHVPAPFSSVSRGRAARAYNSAP